jgi:hypothetical protein
MSIDILTLYWPVLTAKCLKQFTNYVRIYNSFVIFLRFNGPGYGAHLVELKNDPGTANCMKPVRLRVRQQLSHTITLLQAMTLISATQTGCH